MKVTHAQARTYAIDGFKLALATEPSEAEAMFEQGIGLLETSYAQGWKGAGVGSNNVGADQAGRPPCNPANSFLYTDTHPNPDGSSTTYAACFKRYPDLTRGFAGLAEIMYVQMSSHPGKPSVRIAAGTGNIYEVSRALYENGYYEGFGTSPAIRIANHYQSLRRRINEIAAALGEKMPDGFDPLARTLKYVWYLTPMYGDDVARVQRLVGFTGRDVDKFYGPKTKARVQNFQIGYPGLLPDGIVGLDTWHKFMEIEAAIDRRPHAA